MSTVASGGPFVCTQVMYVCERASNPLEIEFQVVVSHPVWCWE